MLEYMNPAELVIASNVRSEAEKSLDVPFLRSIRERGVLVPIVAERDEAGTVTVRYGHRRTLAAQRLGLDRVPVEVRDEAQGLADRIIDQLAENDHRSELAGSDRVRAVAQLALTGMSARTIAKQTAMRPKQVQHALTVAKSEQATHAADTLTLEQAAALVEFEDDAEALEKLHDAAERGQFDHELSRQRQHRAEQVATDQIAAALTAQGIRVVDAPVAWDKPTATPLDQLRDAEGHELDPEAHRDCPGHVGWVESGWIYGDDLAKLDHGAVVVSARRYLYPVIGCEGWRQHGHHARDGHTTDAGEGEALTPEQAEARKAERRRVIANNKAWDAAETVRREWLARFATRKSAPAGAEQLVARALVEGWQAKDYGWAPIGIEPAAFRDELEAGTSKARAAHIGLCLALYRWESETGRHTWRNPHQRDVTVLTALSGWGYPLSDVEAEILTSPTDNTEGDAEDADSIGA